ncbi:uncharacterized protein ISCGN_014126 [Ixodes scapularis]
MSNLMYGFTEWTSCTVRDFGTVCFKNDSLKLPNGNKKIQLKFTEFPERPWQKVGMYFLFVGGSWWLIVTDYYSRCPELVKLTGLTGKRRHQELRVHLCKARHTGDSRQ